VRKLIKKNTNKILYFGSFGKSYDTEVYVANTLETLGCEVTRRPTTKTSFEEFVELMNMKWDAVVFSKGWFVFDQDKLAEIIKNTKNTTIGWFWDLCWGTKREKLLVEHHLFKCDIVLTSDGGDRDWNRYGIKHRTLRQGIYEPEAVLGNKKDDFDYDVVFVGTNVHADAFGWFERDRLIKFLKRTYGTSFKQFGVSREIRNLELNDLYASARVVVGDSVYAKNYWSNRLYETIGRGGFLVFPNVPGIEKEFVPYKHFIPYEYGDYEGLKTKIDYYIKHDKEREEIKLAGFEYCKNNLTYTHRCRELLKIIKELNTQK
jgi:hypothetical protein